MENIDNSNKKRFKETEIDLKTTGGFKLSLTDPDHIETVNEELVPIDELKSENNENISRPYVTKKEIILEEILNNIPGKEIKNLINSLEEKMNEEESEKEVTGLNPNTEILTEKDPDEIIILPNEGLKKTHNLKNKNQPL